jgi:hypothetical protein
MKSENEIEGQPQVGSDGTAGDGTKNMKTTQDPDAAETAQTASDQAVAPSAPCSAIPAFFAGVFCIEETVSGGTGQTPDEAVDDYFANHADDEIDYYTPQEAESGTITVEVFEVYEPAPDDEENVGDWKWMCGERVEKREYTWHIEPHPDYPELPRIVYSPNSQVSTHA